MKKLLFLLVACYSLNGFGQGSKAFIEYGLNYAREGDYKNAINEYTLALDLDSNSYIALNERGCAKIRIGDNEGALEDFKKVTKINPTFENAFNNIGVIYFGMGKNRIAITMYNRAIEINPYFAIGYYSRARSYKAAGEYEKAINDYSKAIEYSPRIYSDETPELVINSYAKNIGIGSHYIFALIDRAKCKAALGKPNEAISDFNHFIKKEPSNAEAYYGRGIVFTFIKKYRASIVDFTSAIKLDTNEYKYYLERGISYSEIDKYNKAKDDLNKVLELDNKCFMAYYELGWINYFKSDYKSGIINFTNAINIYPTNSGSYYCRGLCYVAVGEKSKGCDDFRNAKEYGSPNAFDELMTHCWKGTPPTFELMKKSKK